MKLRYTWIALAALLVVGCVSSSGDKDGIYYIDNPPTDQQVHVMEVPIADIMNPDAERPDLGTLVTMRGVITAVDRPGMGRAGDTDRSFWIQDSLGCGPYHGVQVWNSSLDENMLEPGFEVDVTGTLVETQGVLGVDVQTVMIRDTEPTHVPAHWLHTQQALEGFEGMLVGVHNAKVAEVLANGYALEGGMVVDAALTGLETPKVGDMVTAIGVTRMYGDTMTLLPRAEADVVLTEALKQPPLIERPGGVVVDVGFPPIHNGIEVPPVIDIEIPDTTKTATPIFSSMQCSDVLPTITGTYELAVPHGMPQFATIEVPGTWRQVLEVTDPTTYGVVAAIAEEDTGKEFPRDRLTFMFTCNGDCDSVDVNVGNALENVLEGYRTRYDDVVVVDQSAPEDRPQVLEVELFGELGEARAYYSIDHDPTWQYAIVCWVHAAPVENVASAETGGKDYTAYKRGKTVCKDVKVHSDGPIGDAPSN